MLWNCADFYCKKHSGAQNVPGDIDSIYFQLLVCSPRKCYSRTWHTSYFSQTRNLLRNVEVWVLNEKAKLLTASRPWDPEIFEKLRGWVPEQLIFSHFLRVPRLYNSNSMLNTFGKSLNRLIYIQTLHRTQHKRFNRSVLKKCMVSESWIRELS